MGKKDISVVYMKTIDWKFDFQQRPHHLMRLLANRGYKVHWLNNTHVDGKMRERVTNNLFVYHDHNVFYKRMKDKTDIYFSAWSFRHEDLDFIKPKYGVIYDSLDNFVENEHKELEMINKSDMIMTTSHLLYNMRRKQHTSVVMCPNGCFPEVKDKFYEIPYDIAKIKEKNEPVILLSGAMGAWCDWELLNEVSKRFNVLLVGRNFSHKKGVPPNVIQLGTKPYEELQRYYAHCDLTILPFLRGQVGDCSDPIKTYESLSHGKIVVSTDIPESMKFNSCVVKTSNNIERFIDNIYKALSEKDNEETINECYKIAADNSWEKRIDVIEDCIWKIINNKGK